MTTGNDRHCSSCRWWVPHYVYGSVGECRRHAPRAALKGSVNAEEEDAWQALWPDTSSDDWCGEHEPTETPRGLKPG